MGEACYTHREHGKFVTILVSKTGNRRKGPLEGSKHSGKIISKLISSRMRVCSLNSNSSEWNHNLWRAVVLMKTKLGFLKCYLSCVCVCGGGVVCLYIYIISAKGVRLNTHLHLGPKLKIRTTVWEEVERRFHDLLKVLTQHFLTDRVGRCLCGQNIFGQRMESRTSGICNKVVTN
jgi:hypothetical protein